MRFDKFTLKAQEALATAQQLAMAKSNTVLSSLHLLNALCDDEGLVIMILKKIGSNVARIKEMTESELITAPENVQSFVRDLPPESIEYIEISEEAIQLADEYINEKVVGIGKMNYKKVRGLVEDA